MVLGKKKYSTKIKKPNSSVSKYLYDLWFTVKIQLAKKDLSDWNDPFFIIKLKMLMKLIDYQLKKDEIARIKFKKLKSHTLVKEFLKIKHHNLLKRRPKRAITTTKFGRQISPKTIKKPHYKELN